MARVQFDLHTENNTSNETAKAFEQLAEAFVVSLREAGFEIRGNGLRVQLDPEPEPMPVVAEPEPVPEPEPVTEP